jgi:phosphoglycolate phosphatase-like HAD superfamily hydrolase
MNLYLLDIDGTLLLSGGAGARALNRVFAERYGWAGAMDDIHPNGMTDPAIVELIFAKRGQPPPSAPLVDGLLAAYAEALVEEVAQSPRYRLMPAARELVEALRARGAPMGLATGNTLAGARVKLSRGELWQPFVDAGAGQALGGFGSDSKLRAELVAVAIARAERAYGRRFAGHEVVVVGDTPHDVTAARAVGAYAIAVATGGHSEAELAACAPDEVLPDLTPLVARV